MSRSTALTFEYAKACGILGKAFVGPRAHLLFEQNSLSDLWHLLFNTQAPMMPERLLAEQIEKEAVNKFISQYNSFLKTSGNTNEVLIDPLKKYEIENLKEIIGALTSGESECPELVDLGKNSILHTEQWPDIQKITENTEFSWLSKLPDIHEQQQVDFNLDIHLVQSYWKAINTLSGEIKEAHIQMFLDEYVIKNVIWALRLSVYYEMSEEEVKSKLLYVNEISKEDPLAGPALKILSLSQEDFNAWMNSRYRDLVNPRMDGGSWRIDPAWMERVAQVKIEKTFMKVFHQYPMTTASLVAWFKIKTFELNCIRTAVESIRLNINSTEAMDAVGVTAL